MKRVKRVIERRKMMKQEQVKKKVVRQLYRRRTTMEILDCSLNTVKRLENEGRLTKIRLGARDIHHPAHEVEALAQGEEGE